MTVAVESTTKTYKLLSQGTTRPFTDTAFLFGHMVRLAQPIMTDYQSDMYHDALWLSANASSIAPDSIFTWHWYVSDSHTTIHDNYERYNAYGDKQHYYFRLYLAANGWWSLDVMDLTGTEDA